MDQLRRPRRSAGREILSLHESNAQAASGGVESDATAGGAAADHKNVERVGGASADEGRFLDGSRRDCGVGIDDPPPHGVEGGSAAAIGGRDGGSQGGAGGSGGGDAGDAGEAAEASAAGGHWGAERRGGSRKRMEVSYGGG